MDFLSDNFVFAVFVILAIALQIGRLFIRKAERQRREERGERAEARMEARMEAPAGADKYGKYGEDDDEYGVDNDDEDAFSAWNLSVDDEAAPVIPPPLPAAAPRPVSPPVPESSLFPALIADAALPEEKREPAGPLFPPVPVAGPSAEDRRKGESGGRGNGRAKRGGFPERLDYLPPLKRAVVLAELLGAPKGF